MSRLLTFDGQGIYCAQADIHIDPWKKVKKALITHGHSDHARKGMGAYMCTNACVPILKLRLGKKIKIRGVAYGEKVIINGVQFSFHPAGHVIGSAQIRVEYKGEIWVVSGDYKLVNDGISGEFEPVKCNTFITESTFGLPMYNWDSQEQIFSKINNWWKQNQSDGKVSLITAYSLGKAQRIIHGLDHSIGKVFTHGSIENTNKVIRDYGVPLANTIQVTEEYKRDDYEGSIVIAPSSAANSNWAKPLGDFRTGIASGWMQIRKSRKQRPSDIGFVLSDHADWVGLNTAIKETGANEIFVTHGYSKIFSEYLKEEGFNAKVVKTAFEGERQEPKEVKVT